MRGTRGGWVCAFITLWAGVDESWAQGSLAPTAAPATTMRTLQQIEPRIPISSLPVTLTNSGSYYLTTNLTASAGQTGITVAANNITLDLNGWTLTGSGVNSGHGVYQSSAYRELSVFNGKVVNWTGPSAGGINLQGQNNRVTGIHAYNNNWGIVALYGSRVSDCVAYLNTQRGFWLGYGSLLMNGVAYFNTGDGIEATAATIVDCVSGYNEGNGIEATADSVVRGNTCINNGYFGDGAGILCSGNHNQIVDNHVNGADRGLDINGTDNFIARNFVAHCTNNYDLAAGNQVALVIAELPETINQPCSVTLAGHLTSPTNGLVIAADNVTLDLGGFTLKGDGGVDDVGVLISGTDAIPLMGVTVRNGVIRQFGTGVKVYCGEHCVLENLVVITNRGTGINVIRQAGGGCTGNIVRACTIGANGGGAALVTEGGACDNNTIRECTIAGNRGSGVTIFDGIFSGQCLGNRVLDCTIADNQAHGIYIFGGENNRLEGNHITGHTNSDYYGINAAGADNLIVRNTVHGKDTNIVTTANNTYGPVITQRGELAATGTSAHAWGNFGR